jgi:hypothetical protein
MKGRLFLVSLALVLGTTAGCEKDGAPKGSGELSSSDKDLFKFLPRGETAVFGGNYMKLQKFMTSQLGKATAAAMEKFGPGMTKWMECFVDMHDLKLAGSANVKGKDIQLRMVFTGMKLADVEHCAGQAGFKTATDPDGKFLAIDLPPPAGTQGYLVLDGGAVYTRQSMVISAIPVVTPAGRADLEGDIAATRKDNALGDAKLQALVAKTDRTKTVWFAGSGAGTSVSDKLGELYGSFDISSGIAVDVTFQLTDPALVTKLEDGVHEMKKMSDQLPGDLKDIVQAIQFSRNGDHVRFAVKVSDSQLASIVKQAGMFGGMR